MIGSSSTSRAELPSSGQLVRSTLLAACVAGIVLASAILPAEYGVDPTGLGALTGTLAVGEMKIPLENFPERTDSLSVTLQPGHAAEIKLRMQKGARATFSWVVEGGALNFNSHGEGPGNSFKRYKRGEATSADKGILEAAFYGQHGWFWRNGGTGPVTVRLQTTGNYADIKLID